MQLSSEDREADADMISVGYTLQKMLIIRQRVPRNGVRYNFLNSLDSQKSRTRLKRFIFVIIHSISCYALQS